MKAKDAIIGLGSLLLFYLILQSGLSGLLKFLSSVALLSLVSEYYKKEHNIPTMYVFLLLRTRKGIIFLKKIAKRFSSQLSFLSDVGLGASFGLLSFFLFRWMGLKRRALSFILGMLLVLTISFLYPFAITYIVSFGSIPSPSEPAVKTDVLGPIVGVGGGLFSFMVYLAYNVAISTASSIYDNIFLGMENEVQQTATLLLPGITIPFFEGILALALVLIVHEAAHGLLALVGRVPIKSSGLVFFGSLPVGGFVEPDEEKLLSRPRNVQAHTFVAGITSNLFTALVFGLAYLLFLTLTSPYTVQGCYVLDAGSAQLEKGDVIIDINSKGRCSLENVGPNENVFLELLSGKTLVLSTNDDAKLNITYYPVGPSSPIRVYSNPILDFLYNFLGLAFTLNLFVGIINLLPVPLFDGDHLLRSLVGQGIIYKLVRYSVLLSFLLALVPNLI